MTNKTNFVYLVTMAALLVIAGACSRDHKLGTPSDSDGLDSGNPGTGMEDTDTLVSNCSLVSNCNLTYYTTFDTNPLGAQGCKKIRSM